MPATYRARQKHTDLNGNTRQIYYETDDQSIQVSSANDAIPEGVSTLKDLEDNLGGLAFEDSIEIPDATTSSSGVTMLSNDTSSSSESTAATSKAVSTVNSGAVHKTGNEDIAGTKTFTAGTINIGGLSLRYNPADNELIIE